MMVDRIDLMSEFGDQVRSEHISQIGSKLFGFVVVMLI